MFRMRYHQTAMLFGAICLSCAATVAHAEHRVALLIGNSNYNDKALTTPARDLSALAKNFEKQGVRCTVWNNLSEQKLRESIERFASATPTVSTAIIYFAGQVRPGSYKGRAGAALLGIDSRPGRGYPIELALEQLSTRGGSRVNLFIADAPSAAPPSVKNKLPTNSMVIYHSTAALTKNINGASDLLQALKTGSTFVKSTLPNDLQLPGKGTHAVSSPDQFVFGKKAGDEWVNSRGIVFVWCPPGTYTKGSPPNEPGRHKDEMQSEVKIETGFWISKHELTIAQNPRNRSTKAIGKHKNLPITMINHDDARAMTQRTISEHGRKHENLPAGWQYSLPTEEQWEYAARAGTTTTYHFGNDVNQLPRYANFGDKSYYDTGDIFSLHAHRTLNDGVVQLAQVGSYQPNAWGIHDMHGNVAEWCINYAVRGGSWTSTAPTCRIAYRHFFSSRNEQTFIGYRLVIQKTPPPKPKNTKKK